MSEAFVYCWTDRSNNMLYVGSHKGKIDDGYVCSSKWMIEEYNKRPLDFYRQIIGEGFFIDIRKLESSILKSINAAQDPMMYNQDNGNGNFYLKHHTDETKSKISKIHKGKILSVCQRLIISETHKGKKKSEETKMKMSIAANNMTEDHKLHLSISRKKQKPPRTGPISIEHKRKLSEIGKLRYEMNPESFKIGKCWNKGIPMTEEAKEKSRLTKLQNKEKNNG